MNKSSSEVLAKKKLYYIKNKESILQKEKARQLLNHEEKLKYNRFYYHKNKKRLIKYVIDKRKSNPDLKLIKNLRTRIRNAIKYNLKSAKTKELLGCTLDEFKLHLSSKFKSGMTFENYGEWHIDHIIPVKIFNLSDPTEQKQCFHYTNMQPLWAIDNYTKGCKVEKN